jgi:deoxyadenosine/deoxycytidine kinase
MIIELTGIPGAGKSTILESLKNGQESEGYIFDIQSYILKKSLLPLQGKIAYEFVLFMYTYLLKRSDWELLKNIFMIVKCSSNSLFHKVNILRNSLKKMIIYRYIKEKDEIFFIDEGVSHIPLTVFVDIGQRIRTDELEVFLEHIPPVASLLIIDAPDETLLERVIARGKEGHRRMDFDLNGNVECFMQQSRKVLKLVENHFGGYVYQNIEKNIDTKKIMNELGLKNV